MADTSNKVLAYSVTLWDSGANEYKTFYPGDNLPVWAEGMVRNPKAFQTDEGGDHPSALKPGVDIAIAGPSKLPYDEDPRFVDQPRYMAASTAVNPGYDIAEQTLPVVFASPPTLHDQVAAAAENPEHANEARQGAYEVRTGQKLPEEVVKSMEAQERDLSDANRASAIFEEQQRQMFAAQQESMLQQQAQAAALQMQVAESIRATTAENFAAAQDSARELQNQVVAQNAQPEVQLEAPQGTLPQSADANDDGKTTVDELKSALEAKGLPTNGKKAELEQRLKDSESE